MQRGRESGWTVVLSRDERLQRWTGPSEGLVSALCAGAVWSRLSSLEGGEMGKTEGRGTTAAGGILRCEAASQRGKAYHHNKHGC